MSHLRAPAARADRRESGRHGRPVARTTPPLPETRIRPQLRRLAVLPPIAVALSACAAVLFTVRSTGARATPELWAALAGALGVTLAGILIAAVAADRAARSVADRLDALRRTSARGEADLRALVEALRRGETPPVRTSRGKPAAEADDFELLAAELARAHDGAVAAVVQAAQLSSQAGSEQKLEVFVNLARRLQSLVHREISILDELENEIEDPDLLKGLFHVDHLATRIRRHAENLAVLGGAVARRQWSNPVTMTEVLRSAIAEVEQYARVKLVPPVDGSLRGHAVADVIHLLAELVENATVFSAPQTQVLLRASFVTSGLAVEVEDRGLGMPPGEQTRMNALLADPDQVSVAGLLADGRIGLFVVSQLARRHGIQVRLQTNIYGGVQAVLVVPQALLGHDEATGLRSTPVAAGPRSPRTAPNATGPHSGASGTGPQGRGGPAGPPGTADATGPAPTAVARGPQATAAAADQQATTGPTGPQRTVAATGAEGTARAETRPGPAVRPPRDEPPQPGQTRLAHPSAPASDHPVPPGLRLPRQQTPADPGRSPLPVRNAATPRPNPAEATPGIRHSDRATAAENASRPLTPLLGTVRGTLDKPRLPRRRAQEHLAPQLRGGPPHPVRQDADEHTGHDPGLMAAFRRGTGLAEAQQRSEPDPAEPRRAEPDHARALHSPDHDLTARLDGSAPPG